MTITNPEFYFLGKLQGGNAAREADEAIADLGAGLAVLFVIAAIGGLIYLGLKALHIIG